jgi:hypothetical protein
VIGVDKVVLGEAEIVKAEQILVRHEFFGHLSRPGDIAIGGETVDVIFELELDTFVFALLVIEASNRQRLAELPVIDKIAGKFVIGVDPCFEPREELLDYACVEIMLPLRLDGLDLRGGQHPRIGRRGRTLE